MDKPIFNRTKIIATIGPASSDKETLLSMIQNGVDVCRLNFSHGDYEQHAQVAATIREINEEYGLNVAILCDLQGPKIRVGTFETEYINLVKGEHIYFTTDESKADDTHLYITYGNFPKDVAKGDRILLDDGKIRLEALESDNDKLVKAKIIHGGKLFPKKGVNLPSTNISLPCLTEKDLKDLDFVIDLEPDWIALSFVRESYDIIALRQKLENRQSFAKIIAKIEKPQALENIDDIIDTTDAIMIARGDLGVEVPIEELPLAQKDIVRKSIQQHKPVIIATQIMESMVSSPQPTRAEINDVANAVLDGADALMLSGETSVGEFPVEVIQNMQKIISKVEDSGRIFNVDNAVNHDSETFFSDALCKTAVNVSSSVQASAIVGMTVSGYTAFKLASFRPKAFIFIFTGNHKLLTQLSLIWGVRGYFYDKYVSTDETIQDVNAILEEKGYVKAGDRVINTASMPIHERGRSNTLKITIID